MGQPEAELITWSRNARGAFGLGQQAGAGIEGDLCKEN